MQAPKLTLILSICLILSLFGGVSCAKKPSLAFLDAGIVVSSDTTGASSARARVAFTDYTSSFNGDVLLVTFSDGAGNTMTFHLAGSGGNVTDGTYDIDGAQNTFQAQLVITSNLQPQLVAISGSSGFIEVTSANIDGNQVTSFSGSFSVNFETGGSGTGTFNTAN